MDSTARTTTTSSASATAAAMAAAVAAPVPILQLMTADQKSRYECALLRCHDKITEFNRVGFISGFISCVMFKARGCVRGTLILTQVVYYVAFSVFVGLTWACCKGALILQQELYQFSDTRVHNRHEVIDALNEFEALVRRAEQFEFLMPDVTE